jgi:hypothetical protein
VGEHCISNANEGGRRHPEHEAVLRAAQRASVPSSARIHLICTCSNVGEHCISNAYEGGGDTPSMKLCCVQRSVRAYRRPLVSLHLHLQQFIYICRNVDGQFNLKFEQGGGLRFAAPHACAVPTSQTSQWLMSAFLRPNQNVGATSNLLGALEFKTHLRLQKCG